MNRRKKKGEVRKERDRREKKVSMERKEDIKEELTLMALSVKRN